MTPDRPTAYSYPLNASFMGLSGRVHCEIFRDECAQSFRNWEKLPSQIRRSEVSGWRKLADRAVSAYEQRIALRYRELGLASALEPGLRAISDFSAFEEWKALFIELLRQNQLWVTAKNAARIRRELTANVARIGTVFEKEMPTPMYNGQPMARMMDNNLLYLLVKPRSDGVAVANIVCCAKEAGNPMIEHVGLHGILTIDNQPLTGAEAISVAVELQRHVRAFESICAEPN